MISKSENEINGDIRSLDISKNDKYCVMSIVFYSLIIYNIEDITNPHIKIFFNYDNI